jgi:hypothetical protein
MGYPQADLVDCVRGSVRVDSEYGMDPRAFTWSLESAAKIDECILRERAHIEQRADEQRRRQPLPEVPPPATLEQRRAAARAAGFGLPREQLAADEQEQIIEAAVGAAITPPVHVNPIPGEDADAASTNRARMREVTAECLGPSVAHLTAPEGGS